MSKRQGGKLRVIPTGRGPGARPAPKNQPAQKRPNPPPAKKSEQPAPPLGVPGLKILQPNELAPGERGRIEKLIRRVAPQGQLKGVFQTTKAWDLRPIITEPGSDFTSLIRLFGPEVTLSLIETERAKSFIEILSTLPYSGAEILNHGSIDGQLFIRRPLFVTSLAERLTSNERFSYRAALGISLEVIRILRLWHEHHVLHGHLCPGNICFSNLGEIAVVDPCIRLGQMRAAKEIGIREEFSQEKYLAPEVLAVGDFSAASDVFALGHVLQDLFRRVKRRPAEAEGDDTELEWMTTEDLEALRDLSTRMCDDTPEARPPLEQVERVLEARSFREKKPAPAAEIETSPAPPVAEEGSSEPVRAISQQQLISDIDRTLFGGDVTKRAVENREERASRRESYVLRAEDLVAEQQTAPVVEPPAVSERATLEEPGPVLSTPLPQEEAPPVAGETPFAPQEIDDRAAFQEVSPEPEGAGEVKENGQFLKYAVIVLSVLCAYLAYRNFFSGSFSGDFSEMTDSELNAAWDSSVSSEMSLVAAAAVQSTDSGDASQQKAAERIILRSAFAEGRFSEFVNYPLIRLAFDKRWEMKLNADDRRVALTIALGKLLGEKYLPKEKVDLTTIHPGVLFSVLAVMGNVPGVAQVPASKLVSLPPPINIAFQQLLEDEPNLLCGDASVLGLAKMYAKERLNVDELLRFLQDHTEARLRALAILFSENRIKSQEAIELLLNHPNLRLEHETVRWGIRVKLNKWQGHPATDLLFVLAGLRPPGALSKTEYVQLLAHPIPRMRQVAIEGVIDQIPLTHPAAVPMLKLIKDEPQLLDGKQTLELAQFLETPERATREAVRTWCESKPNPNLMARLLSSTAAQNTATSFDSNLSLCLQGSNWKPTVDELRVLSHHPDSLTRVFVYAKLLDLGAENPSTALEIYTDALHRETREDLKQQIEQNISSLKLR